MVFGIEGFFDAMSKWYSIHLASVSVVTRLALQFPFSDLCCISHFLSESGKRR